MRYLSKLIGKNTEPADIVKYNLYLLVRMGVLTRIGPATARNIELLR